MKRFIDFIRLLESDPEPWPNVIIGSILFVILVIVAFCIF